MAVDYVEYGNDEGTNFGRSDGKIGFYGLTTPIVQPDFTQAALSATPIVGNTSVWGFTTSSEAANIITMVNEIRAKLVALNLIAT